MYEDETLICKCEQENCGFLFEQLGEVEWSPNCNSQKIRPANEKEQKEYIYRRNRQ